MRKFTTDEFRYNQDLYSFFANIHPVDVGYKTPVLKISSDDLLDMVKDGIIVRNPKTGCEVFFSHTSTFHVSKQYDVMLFSCMHNNQEIKIHFRITPK